MKPNLSLISGSAPASIKYFTISKWPCFVAISNAEWPEIFSHLWTSAFLLQSILTAGWLPICEASINKVIPHSSFSFIKLVYSSNSFSRSSSLFSINNSLASRYLFDIVIFWGIFETSSMYSINLSFGKSSSFCCRSLLKSSKLLINIAAIVKLLLCL